MEDINNLLEKRREAMRHDHANGLLDRAEYIAVKVELMAIQMSVNELAARQERITAAYEDMMHKYRQGYVQPYREALAHWESLLNQLPVEGNQ